MMNTEKCPKCHSADIIRIDGFTEIRGGVNTIRVGLFSFVKVNRYVCCKCGFTEEWIDQEDIEKLM